MDFWEIVFLSFIYKARHLWTNTCGATTLRLSSCTHGCHWGGEYRSFKKKKVDTFQEQAFVFICVCVLVDSWKQEFEVA